MTVSELPPSASLEQRVRLLESQNATMARKLHELEQRLMPKGTWKDLERQRYEQVKRQIEEALYEGCDLGLSEDVGSSVPELMQVLERAEVPIFRTEHSQKIMLAKVLKEMGVEAKINWEGRYYAGIRPKSQEN